MMFGWVEFGGGDSIPDVQFADASLSLSLYVFLVAVVVGEGEGMHCIGLHLNSPVNGNCYCDCH